ncbi:MAG: DUF4394 domain-containing protein [Pseudomonadota bacterium]
MQTFSLKASASAAAAVAALVFGAPAHAEPVLGLTTTNALFTFDSATPTNASTLNTITGLQGVNERILSIDLRPTTGVLYGVSSDDKVYSLTSTGQATFVGGLGAALASDVIGIDFNPAADLAGMASLRVVSSTGQNIAYNVATGMGTVATPIQPSFAAVAYSNNDLNAATATSLYYIDIATDTLRVATTAFNAPTINPVGSLGFNANGVAGFDIGASGAAFAALTDADTGKSGLYSINLATGSASFVGAFGIGGNTAISPPLLGLTLITAPIPEPSTYALMLAGLLGIGWVARRRSPR